MTCPACGRDGMREVYVDRWPTGFEKHVHRCGGCGLAMAHPMPTAAELTALYDSRDYFEGDEERHLGYTRYHPPVAWFCDVLRQVCRAGVRGPVLDVGSATGEFLLLAGARGLEAVGIEPSEWAAQQARAAGTDTRVGLFEEVAGALCPGAFGAITLSHVIEHFRDPQAILMECARLLRPGGVVALWTPNYASPVWRDPERAYAREGREHLVYFTPDSLRRTVEAAGLRMVRLVSQPCPTPGAWAEAERFYGRSPSWRRLPDKWLTWAYKGGLLRALRPMRWGDLLALACKP